MKNKRYYIDWDNPMSIGSFMLATFIGAIFIAFVLWLLDSFNIFTTQELIDTAAQFMNFDNNVLYPVIICIIPLIAITIILGYYISREKI